MDFYHKMVDFKRIFTILITCVLTTVNSIAADIVISGSTESGIKRKISLSEVRTDASPHALEFLRTLKNDLLLSGWFVESDAKDAAVKLSGEIRCTTSLSSSITAKWLADTRSKNFLKNSSIGNLRKAAHEESDRIVFAVTGHKGMACSKVLFVGRRSSKSNPDIYVCDADGKGVMQLTKDAKMCLSPNWQDGENAFMYTSWLTGVPAVYKVDLNTGKRNMICGFPGMNAGAVLSPDKRWMAVVLSRSGSVDLYLMDVATKKLRRMTRSKDVNESSPTWSPDGRKIAFVDDRERVPQIRIMDVNDDRGVSVTAISSIRESTAPEWGKNGQIVFSGRKSHMNRYQIFVLDASRGVVSGDYKLVSPDDGADYEDPSWAPDGRHIVCTRTKNYQRSLVILDTLGDAPRTLVNLAGEWYLPSWSDNF